jgi:hypothetical protein
MKNKLSCQELFGRVSVEVNGNGVADVFSRNEIEELIREKTGVELQIEFAWDDKYINENTRKEYTKVRYHCEEHDISIVANSVDAGKELEFVYIF